MIPWLYELLAEAFALEETPFRILRFATVRGVGAFAVAFLFVLATGRHLANWLYRVGMRDRVRDYGEYFTKSKSGTPTAGGLVIIGGTVVATLTFGHLESRIMHLLVLTVLWFGGLGALDDVLKIWRGSSDAGLSRGVKILGQILFALFIGLMIISDGTSPFPEDVRTCLFFPFPGPQHLPPLDLGAFYLPFCVFVIVAIANAINFADGLDGLAVLPSALTAAVFGVFAYLSWNASAARFLELEPLQSSAMAEIAIFAAAIVGACFGFLWFNGYPAQLFMGDTGSMALGGSVGALAVLVKQELLFLIAGAIFVFEAFSVLLQDYVGIRWIGRRLFFRAPAHHGYQHRGIAEPKVVLRFWIVSILCAVVSLATLKLR